MSQRYRKLQLMIWLGAAALGLMLGTPLSAAELSASPAIAQPGTPQAQPVSEPQTNNLRKRRCRVCTCSSDVPW
jgi:hypothetical protein